LNSKAVTNTHRPYAVAEGGTERELSPSEDGGKSRDESLPTFKILGLNKTIDGQYCFEGCKDPKRGNYTYYIPVSKYMPHIPLEVKFSMDEKQVLQYCWKSTGDYCYGVEQSYFVDGPSNNNGRAPRSSKTDAESDVYQRQADTWELPVGIYQESTYRFRVGSSTMLCSLMDDEVGATFVEYNLHFYRTCN